MSSTDKPFTSQDAYKLIHEALGGWISVALEHGFEGEPNAPRGGASHVDGLVEMADTMGELEDRMGAGA